jgi:hypothetical protein
VHDAVRQDAGSRDSPGVPRLHRALAPLLTTLACQAPATPDDPIASGTASGSDEGGSDAPTPGTSTGAAAGSSSGGADESADDGPLDTGTTGADEGLVPMFVAQGMLGRTTISCDGGRTWVADRAWEAEAEPLLCGNTDPVRCWETACTYLSGDACVSSAECDCGHHPGFSKGIAFGNGWFVATWGWGYSGSVRRSADGVHWEQTLTDDVTFGGLAFGSDRFVLASRNPRASMDGAGWVAGQEADFRGPDGEIAWSVRRFAHSGYDGGRFVAVAEPPKAVLVSADGGESWWAPSVLPEACLADLGSYGGIAANDEVIVAVSPAGNTCRSTDGGDTWTEGSVGGGEVYSQLVWTGTEFVAWSPGTRYGSPDGQSWTATPTTPEGIRIGPVAHDPDTGTFVAVRNVWEGYEAQQMLRSEDGLEWEALGPDAFTGGHAIFHIAFGHAAPSDVCPAP